LLSERCRFGIGTGVTGPVAGIDGEVGSLRQELYADRFVLMGEGAQPYTTLAHAKPEDVHRVLVGGVPIYGSEKLMGAFQVKTEPLEICGKKMSLNSDALTAGSFADVSARLKADLSGYQLELGPLEECAKSVP